MAIALTAVAAPLEAVLYDVPVVFALLLTVVQGAAVVAALVIETQRAGAAIRLELHVDDDADVSTATGIAAHRIVQEAISNAVRHAPGSGIEARVWSDAGQLRIEVTNSAPPVPPSAGAGGDGHRLIGMRERASILGGQLRAKRIPPGGFQVTAALPLQPREATT